MRMTRAKLPTYDAENLAHARRVLADPERWGGGHAPAALKALIERSRNPW